MWCPNCIAWYAAQRAEKPSFSRQGHLVRCPCECHPENADEKAARERRKGRERDEVP